MALATFQATYISTDLHDSDPKGSDCAGDHHISDFQMYHDGPQGMRSEPIPSEKFIKSGFASESAAYAGISTRNTQLPKRMRIQRGHALELRVQQKRCWLAPKIYPKSKYLALGRLNGLCKFHIKSQGSCLHIAILRLY